MTRFSFTRTTVEHVTVDIELPESVAEYMRAGVLLNSLSEEAEMDLFWRLDDAADVSSRSGSDATDLVNCDITITGTDLPGQRPSLPVTI